MAYVLGTHKDLMEEKDISDFDGKLQEIVRHTYFYEKEILNNGRLLLPIDNMRVDLYPFELIVRFPIEAYSSSNSKI